LPISKLRRRRADRCTFPIEWGHNGEAGVTVRGGANRLREAWYKPPKKPVTLPVDADVLAWFKESGI
jgi:uncharacterized protein (DUF4415 family)